VGTRGSLDTLLLIRIQSQFINSKALSLVVLPTALSWLPHCVLINFIVKSKRCVPLVKNVEIRSMSCSLSVLETGPEASRSNCSTGIVVIVS
jgi:hypothetical protein